MAVSNEQHKGAYQRTVSMKTAPAFMFYASDTMADRRFRLMSLAERGLYLSMLCECWVNVTVPSDVEQLSKLLSYQVGDVKASLTERVLSHFKLVGNDLINSELELYRETLLSRREKLSNAGKKGVKAKQYKASIDVSHPSSHPSSLAKAPRDEMRGNEKSRKASLDNSDIKDDFVRDYDKYDVGLTQ